MVHGPPDLELRVLGPVSAARGGRPVRIGGPRQQMLAARLVVAAHGPSPFVTAAALIDDVWDGEAAPSALKMAVTRLRSTLGDDSIVTERGRYALAGPITDVHAFETLVTEARTIAGRDAAVACASYLRALDLWTGNAYEDYAHTYWARLEADRLEEMRFLARTERLRLMLHEDLALALVETAVFAEQHPDRGEPTVIAALALYRSGRELEALETCRRHTTRAREEFGLEPIPMVRRTERAILDHAPTLDGPNALDALTSSFGVTDTPRSSFVERPVELQAISDALFAHGTVVLVGGHGVGKTRLATETMSATADRFRDATVLVALGAIPSAAHLDRAVLERLGLTDAAEADQRSAGAILTEFLADRSVLIVLDAAEHLDPHAVESFVRDLTSAHPLLRFLVTTTTPIEVPGSKVIAVGGLDTPAQDANPVDIASSPAVKLLIGRQGISGPDASELDRLAAMARANDGLPLALELASARESTPPLEARHHELLARVSVFRSDFDVVAAAAVAADVIAADHVAGLLAHLIDAGLIHRTGDHRRFRVLDSVRTEAARALERHGQAQAARTALHVYYREFVAVADRKLRGHGQIVTAAALDAELDNLRDVIDTLVHQRDPVAAELAGDLVDYTYMRGHWAEARSMLSAVRAIVDGERSLRNARVLRGLASSQGFGSMHAFVSELEESVAISAECGSAEDEAWSLLQLATAVGGSGDFERMFELLDRAAKRFDQVDDPWCNAVHRSYVAIIGAAAGNTDTALGEFTWAADEFDRLGDLCWRGRVEWFHGTQLRRAGDIDGARDLLERALSDSRTFGDRATTAHVLLGLARTSSQQCRPSTAADYDAAIEALVRIGDRHCATTARDEAAAR